MKVVKSCKDATPTTPTLSTSKEVWGSIERIHVGVVFKVESPNGTRYYLRTSSGIVVLSSGYHCSIDVGVWPAYSKVVALPNAKLVTGEED